MRINVYLFIFILHTDWKVARDSSKDMNEFWGVYAQTSFGMHTQTISEEILEISSKQEKSHHSGYPAPDLDRESNIHLTLGVGGQRLGYGTTVTAFQRVTSAPSLWTGSSMSAVPDKEAAPLPQEASHNYPDTSGDALHIATNAPGRSMPDDSVHGQISVVPGQAVSENLVADVKSEVSLLLRSSSPSPTLSPVTVLFTQSLGGPLQAADSGAESRGAKAPPLSTAGQVEVSSPRPPPATTVTSLGSFPDAVSLQSDSYVTSPSDLPGGKHHVDMGTTPSSSASLPSEGGHVEFDTHSVSPTDRLPAASDVIARHLLLTVPADSADTKDSIQHGDRLPDFWHAPGTGELEVAKRHSDSPFTLGLSQEPKGESATGPGALLGRGSRSVTHKGSALGSVLEDTTYMGLGLSHMTDGVGTGGVELNTADEASHPDVPLLSSTERSSATHVFHIVDNVTSEESRVSIQSRRPDSRITATNTYAGLDDQGTRDSSTFRFQQELTAVSHADLHPAGPRTNPQHSSAQSHSTEVLNMQPESSGSTASNSYNQSSISLTGMSETYSLAESKTNLETSFQSATSNSASTGTQLNGDSTLHRTISPQIHPISFEDKLSRHRTHSGLVELTTTPYMVSVFPALTQRSSVSHSPDGRTYTSSIGHSENENTSTEHTTREYTQRVTQVHTLTVSSTGSEKIPLSMSEGMSTSVAPPTPSTLEVSSPTFLSPDGLPMTPRTPERVSPSVQSGAKQASTQNCHDCVIKPLVTVSSTVSTSEHSTRSSPARTTTAPPSTAPPKTTPEVPGNPLTTERAVPMGPTSAHSRPETTPRSSAKPVKERIFIVEDQPAILKEETAQLLLQIVLASGPLADEKDEGLEEDVVAKLHPFLKRASGFQALQLSWTSSSAVVQSVATFDIRSALLWLGVPGAPLLEVTGLSDAVTKGLYVKGVRVQKITVGGLQSDPCSWLFLCPPGFRCVPAHSGNASCTSLCHADYCKNDGICTHRRGEPPACQCPVGEDFWFMGRQCDSPMTRQRLLGVCLGVLVAAALLMAAVSFLVVRHFKAMLIQAKVDQTRSSYRRFNHFDELSGRFWLRSWPGSADSLDNPIFSRSDELLHLRALDQTCCYHDDTLSIVSTLHGSETQLNTIYTHGSQYNWDLSGSSINDFLADSGKASDISVCSWPIEPIQWTPFPLLQQLGIQRPTKTSRPRSYCEGMELVGMEKTWTAHHHS